MRQHFLYFLSLPHGHLAFGLVLVVSTPAVEAVFLLLPATLTTFMVVAKLDIDQNGSHCSRLVASNTNVLSVAVLDGVWLAAVVGGGVAVGGLVEGRKSMLSLFIRVSEN